MLLLSHKVELFVHFLLNQTHLILLDLRLGDVFAIRVKDVHSFEIEGTDAPHEGFLEIFLHNSFHSVALVDVVGGLV